MRHLTEDWEFNVLDIVNYNKPGAFEHYFRFIIENHSIIEGDICEVGVFRGKSILATAMLLKEIGSSKLVWGFDSFTGFPTYHENDDLKKFDELYQEGKITEKLYQQVKLNQEYRTLVVGEPINVSTISSSTNFADTSLPLLRKKIEYLGLDNIRLIQGVFSETMHPDQYDKYPPFCAALIDCDLYESYKVSLPFAWHHMSQGGYLYLDEYYSLKFPGARLATDEFFADKPDKPQMHLRQAGDFERWHVRKILSPCRE